MSEITELDLVKKFRDAKLAKDAAEAAMEQAQAEYDATESELIELLEAKGATKTAEYDGVGHVTLLKPQLYASVKKENTPLLLTFLREIGRAEMIKEAVNSKTLSSFVADRVKQGEGVPEFIGYYLKSSARFYGK
jgi:hypothetical protein